MRVLVIGRSGQVAQALKAVGGDGVRCVGRPDIDLSDKESIQRVVSDATEDVVINAAAYTSVDGAESHREDAYLLNETGPLHLAEACRGRGLPLIHLSTDCVFDGQSQQPYRRGDATSPLGVYGASKLAGEAAVLRALPQSLVFRITWVFSEYGSNFVRTMLRLASDRDEIQVVSDQIGCPSYAPDIAKSLLSISRQCLAPGFDNWGAYHLAGNEAITRSRMAEHIMRCSAALNGLSARILPILTQDYSTPAERPLNARLDSADTTETFGTAITDWQTSLRHTVAEILKDGSTL